MSSTNLYGMLLAGGFCYLLVHRIIKSCYRFGQRHQPLWNFVSHRCDAFILQRYRLIGPWTGIKVVAVLTVWGCNAWAICWDSQNLREIGKRAAILSLFNLVPCYLSSSIVLCTFLELRFVTARFTHKLFGVTAFVSVVAHLSIAVLYRLVEWKHWDHVCSIAGIGGLLLLLPPASTIQSAVSHEFFRSVHITIAILIYAAIAVHIGRASWWQFMVLLIIPSWLAGIAVAHLCNLVFTNWSPRHGRTKILCCRDLQSLRFTIEVPRTMHVRPGQYIRLHLPLAGLQSCFQSYSFLIVAWHASQFSTTLDLIVLPENGFTRTISARVKLHAWYGERNVMDPSRQQLTDGLPPFGHDSFYGQPAPTDYKTGFVLGPFGATDTYTNVGKLVMLAEGQGLIAHLPHLLQYLDDVVNYRTCTREVHVIWEIEKLADRYPSIELLWRLLCQETLPGKVWSQYLQITIYYPDEAPPVGLQTFGQCLAYQCGVPDLDSILRGLLSDSESIHCSVMIAGRTWWRDKVRKLMAVNHANVALREVEYQTQ